MHNLGCCFEQGTGTAVDMVKAVEWFSRAAAAGNSNSQLALATHLFHGSGIIRDTTAALT